MAVTVQLSNESAAVSHPYYPQTVHLPHYVRNETTVFSLVAQFGFLWAAVMSIAFIAIRRIRPTASRSDQIAFTWMCLSTYLHLIL